MKSSREPGFDTADDLRRAGQRLEIIRYLAVAIFILLVGRLWILQVMKSEVFAEQAEQNRTRILPIPARRGTIFDRHGKILVTSQSSYNIVLSREDVKERDFPRMAEILVRSLKIDQDWLNKRFEAAKYEAKSESIVVKEFVTSADIAWVRAHQFEYPMIRYEEAPRRLYPFGIMAAHALGYVGEVDKKELNDPKSPFSRERGYKLGDIIGKGGIERTYNDVLAGKDGERRVVVDSKGRIQREIDRIEPIAGRDFYSTLDLDIQKVAEAQTDSMPAGRGAIAVMDPRNGEILAMVSHPAFDPNVFSLRAKTDEGKEEIRELQQDDDRPLYNRVIQGQFPPGSTWKLMTTVAALNEGVITPTNNKIQDGSIQLGSYYMTSMSHDGFPDINRAILHSCDGYFYRLGLKMGVERFEKWVDIFRFGQRTGIDLPGEYRGIAPVRATKLREFSFPIKKAEKQLEETTDPKFRSQLEFRIKQLEHESRWTDYDMAASAFGQGRNASTPIQLLRYVQGLANGGFMYTPHLFLRSVAGIDREGKQQPQLQYEDKNKFIVPMSAEIHEIVKKGMWGAVHDGSGTAGAARVEGFDVCGKTGTAQVASKDKAGSKNKDHAWFMSFAPRDKPEICSIVLTEIAGFGGKQSAPRAKEIYEDYYRRTRGLDKEPVAEAASATGAKAGDVKADGTKAAAAKAEKAATGEAKSRR
jgi:penicillin-binding protein 2